MNIGNVQQCDVAKLIEPEEILFGEPLLGKRVRKCIFSSRKCRGRGTDLEDFTPRDHARWCCVPCRLRGMAEIPSA